MTIKVQDVLARIPGWAAAGALQVEPLGGLTNANYRVTVNGERFIVRVSGENTALLGIQRAAEWEALSAAAKAGIAPEVVYFLWPEGHCVTRALAGRHLTLEEYCTPANLRRVVETVKRLHRLPPIQATFSPFRWVEARVHDVLTLGVPLPAGFDALLDRMRAIEAAQQPVAIRGFCHNDLFSVNFMDDGAIRILDWEFAGMGDVYLDLATLVYAYDSEGPLPAELQDYLLECYFGAVTAAQRAAVRRMLFMIRLRDGMWALIQEGIQRRSGTRHPDFDYGEFGQAVFAELWAFPSP
jgi:thiamine kinase-like enzyme